MECQPWHWIFSTQNPWLIFSTGDIICIQALEHLCCLALSNAQLRRFHELTSYSYLFIPHCVLGSLLSQLKWSENWSHCLNLSKKYFHWIRFPEADLRDHDMNNTSAPSFYSQQCCNRSVTECSLCEVLCGLVAVILRKFIFLGPGFSSVECWGLTQRRQGFCED